MARHDPEELFSAAKEYFIEGHYKIVESMIQQLLIVDERNPDVHYMAGTLAFEKGKLKQAIQHFKKSLQIDPHFTDSSIGLSIILNDLGKYDEGKRIFEEAYALMKQKGSDDKPYFDESIAKKHEELGDIYFLAKQYEEALENFNRASKISSNKVFYGIKSIDCLLQMKLLSRAEREAQELLEAHPEDTRILNSMAKIQYQLGNHSKADESWQRILAKEPNNTEAKNSLIHSQKNISMEL